MFRKLLVVLIAPLLTVVACTDDGDQSQRVEIGDTAAAIAALRAAPDAAAAVGSGRMEMTIGLEVDGQAFELTSTGVFTGTQMRMEMDLGALLAAQLPDGDLPPGMDEPMVIVVDGATSYLRMPMLDTLSGTSGWLSVSPEDLGLASDALGMGFGATNSPTDLLETLRGISDDIEELGTEDIRGTDTIHYRAVVDLAKALEQVPDELKPQLEAQLGAFDRELPVEVWLDGDGLVRRLAMDLADLLAGAAPEGDPSLGGGSLVMEIFDYGAEVVVDLPDPDEVRPFTEIMGGLG